MQLSKVLNQLAAETIRIRGDYSPKTLMQLVQESILNQTESAESRTKEGPWAKRFR